MQKTILLIVLLILSALFVTKTIAQTYPPYYYSKTGTGTNPSTHPLPSILPSTTYPTYGQQPGGKDYPTYQPTNTTPGLTTDKRPGTTSGFTPPRTFDTRPLTNRTQPGSTSANMQTYKQQQCQTIEKTITSQADKGLGSLIKTYQMLLSIFTGVQNYYTAKLVPAGISLQNYPSLISQAQASQSAVLTSIQVAQNDINTFSCTNDPGKQIMQFRQDMQNAIKSLIGFRDAVKDLVSAIRVAAQNVKDTTSLTATSSAK